MKRLLCLLLSAILIAVTPSAVMAEETAINATIVFLTGAQELNLTAPGEFNLSYKVDNKSMANRINASASYTLSDDNGEELWSGSEDVNVSPGGTKSFKITGTLSKYGVHTLEIVIKDKNGGSTVSATKEISLSKRNIKVNDTAGVSAHFAWNTNPNSTIPYLKNMGAKFVRDEIYWKDYEKEMGKYKLPEKAEDYVNKLVEHGLEPLIILDFGNALYTKDDNAFPQTDDEINAYGNYVYNLVKDLKGRVKYFEVWNEMNLKGVEYGGTYAKMLKTAYSRAKDANPECVIIGPVTAGTSRTFFANMKSAVPDIADYMDILSFHEYYDFAPETQIYEDTLKSCVSSLKTYFGSEREVWLTEMGYSEGNEGITERDAAMYTVRQLLNNSAEKIVDKMFVYNWINHAGHSNPYEANLGLLNGDCSAKKGYVAMSAMNYFLTDFELSGRTIDAQNYVYTYKKGDETVIVLYNADDTAKTVSVETDADNYAVYDMYGNKTEDLTQAGTHNISVTGEPVYIVSPKDDVIMDYKSNTAEIRGKIEGASSAEPIMVYVTKPETSADGVLDKENLVYINQVSLSNDGSYEFGFPISEKSGVYNIYIGYGKNEALIGPVKLEVVRIVTGTTGIYNENGLLNTLADVKVSGTDIVAKATVNNSYNAKLKTVLYAAGLKGDCVVWTKSTDKDILGYGQHSVDMKLDKSAVSDADEIRLYLWTEDMQPIANQVTSIE